MSSERRLPTCIELSTTNEDLLARTVQDAADYVLMHMGGIRYKDCYSPDSLFVVPFTILPSTFFKEEFDKASNIQVILNKLTHKVAYSSGFLKEALCGTIKVDDFTRNLFKIYERVMAEGIVQPVSLGLFRSDYLLDTDRIKQVEINTVSTSLASISTIISKAHRFVLRQLGHEDKLSHLPQNNAASELCEGLTAAWLFYNIPAAVIMFVVEPIVYNICDQRYLEYHIRNEYPSIGIIRRTFSELAKGGTSLDQNKRLIVDGLEVAVVYYRTGYTPAQYDNKSAWDIRLLLERSKAIKCPSIQYHLAGTKKVQQMLSTAEHLNNFLTPEEVTAVQDVFTNMYSLDMNEEGDRTVEMIKHQEMSELASTYVLKPQREGGGNNIYGEDIMKELSRIGNSNERAAYILMKKLVAPVQSNYVVRPRSIGDQMPLTPTKTDVISELGIYGVIIGDDKNIYLNKPAGHLLRTKEPSANEGGIAIGIGLMDSPYLI